MRIYAEQKLKGKKRNEEEESRRREGRRRRRRRERETKWMKKKKERVLASMYHANDRDKFNVESFGERNFLGIPSSF